MIEFARAAIRDILENAGTRTWTLQGLGMLRTYIGDDMRLHVWDGRFAQPDVSTMHDHPWDMESLIISGSLGQCRYVKTFEDGFTEPWMEQTIVCGEGGGLCGSPELVYLAPGPLELYGPGETYSQRTDEIHVSMPNNGTVTLIKRTVPAGGSPDLAHVYFLPQEEWVSAEPRAATPDEVEAMIANALERW